MISMGEKDQGQNWRERLSQWASQTGQRAADEARSLSNKVSESTLLQQARANLEASPLWSETSRMADRIKASEAWQQVEDTAQRAAAGSRFAAQRVGARVEQLQREAETLLAALEKAQVSPEDRDVVVLSAVQAFEKAGPHLDLLADAFVVGSIQEAGAGLASVQGGALVFVPPDGPVRGQLRVSRFVGQAARLAVGGHLGAYVAALYAPRDLVVRPLQWRGAGLGLVALSLGFFRATGPEPGAEAAGGWLLELSAGVGLGIPLVSDLSAFELEEVDLAAYSLSADESAKIESALSQAPDRAARRRVARMLSRDPEAKPG